MTGTEWAVVVGGIAAIAWVNWYFFLAGRAGTAPGAAPPEETPAADRRERGTRGE